MKRTLAEYLSRVQNELPANDPLDEMNNEAYLNLPTSKAVMRFVIDHYKPFFISQQYSEDDEDDVPDPGGGVDTGAVDPNEDETVVSYSLSEKAD